MVFDQEKILKFYANGCEENRAKRSRSNFLEFYYTEKILRAYINKDSCIIELGCGTGYYGMLFVDVCAKYTGIDISQENITEFEQKIRHAQKQNIHAMVGNATNLSGIPDKSYDLVLCLGPMYHLPPEERQKVFQECFRIGRDNAKLLAYSIRNGPSYTGLANHALLVCKKR